jgi:hypothetical protein
MSAWAFRRTAGSRPRDTPTSRTNAYPEDKQTRQSALNDPDQLSPIAGEWCIGFVPIQA